jgi:hypothetical protein
MLSYNVKFSVIHIGVVSVLVEIVSLYTEEYDMQSNSAPSDYGVC